MANIKFYIRRWLNKERHHGGAHIIASVDSRSWVGERDKKKYVEVSADLTISDCNRVITLDLGSFGSSFERDKKNALYKAHTLRHSINQFVEAVEAAYEQMEEELQTK